MNRRVLLALLVGLMTASLLPADDKDLKANPEATKLLSQARAARALWSKFPGFTANVTVTVNGQTHQGTVQVTEKGKVSVSDLPEKEAAWCKGVLGSAVAHRLSSGEEPEMACVFGDEEIHHPLGRLVRVTGDDMGSSYRIRDQQIMMVNRQMGKMRFSITMLENQRNEEGKYLPHACSVHYWDAKTGELTKTESHFQAWNRQQGIDLPTMIRVITVDKGVDSREIALSHFKLS
jgi:hypothetical protein